MGIIDIVLLVIIGVFGIKGLLKGLINEIFGIIAIVAGSFIAFAYSAFLTGMLISAGLKDGVANAVGYAGTFIIVYLVVAIIGVFISKAFKDIKLGWLNRGGGFLFGVIKSAVVCSLILSAVLSVLSKDVKIRKDVDNSIVAGNLVKMTPYIYEMFNKIPKDKKNNPFSGLMEDSSLSDKINEKVDDAKEKVSDMTKEQIEKLSDKELDKLLDK